MTPSPRARALGALSGLALLAGCASLPSSGPTASEIRRGTQDQNQLGFKIVDIDGPLLQQIVARDAAADAAQPTLSSLARDGRNDVVGPGDLLSIGIYEVGVSLFGSSADSGGVADPSARAETFPEVIVDRDGTITLPYVGRLNVAGHSTTEIEAMIVRGLKGKSQTPQALVSIKQNISSTVYVAGDVHQPGRYNLTLQSERLLDAIALAGGATNSAEDTVVRFNRGSQFLEERLGRIRAGAADDLMLVPGDRVELLKRPRSFISLGATGKVEQTDFETGEVSLAEAVARAGGPTDSVADPSAVFLFRYDPAAPGGTERPIIYRLNMLQPASYFLAQRFAVRDKDVIYIANAAANRPAKMVNIINQLFSPFVAARAVTR
ncbi:MAG TPA: polysaccharide biosynthesis/export family protein [Sphingomonas sp.]|uniref:polysaccharide biosynthesis/export family protein n=1 Tax=Sphingomonas sp. TaxID=28214 RepID=UPI002D1E3413|nr:polysaccharide biosynthesis/export family protein [Sphingomonas sp.]HMI20225.1 polysaccharide biosynthesis/export family protein [Sphingomonas sp.]